MEIPGFEEQLKSLMPPLGLGFLLGLVYDMIRILRLIVPSKKIFVFVTDALFVLFCTTVSYLLFIAVANGSIRAYMVIAEIIGALVYRFGIGFFIFSAAEKIGVKINKLLKSIFSPFLFVFRKIKSVGTNSAKNITKKLKKYKNKLKKPLQDDREMLYNEDD